MTAGIGLIGLGVMGANLALNILEKGYKIAVFNASQDQASGFLQSAEKWRESISLYSDIPSLLGAIHPPRPIIIMIPAGLAVEEQINALLPSLSPGDIIIDAGNSDFNDTRRREARLQEHNVCFIGLGISGGKEGARYGASMMAGGNYVAWKHIEPLLTSISAKHQGEPCAAWLGPDGSGHFVKTIHNGIEYSDMQMIAEVYGFLRDGANFSASEISNIFNQWNSGCLRSYLTEAAARVLSVKDPLTDHFMVDMITDHAEQKGTGKWATIEAQKLSVPATCIESAVAARIISSMSKQRILAHKIYGSKPKYPFMQEADSFINDLETALLAGRILAYAQGFTIMQEASNAFNWNLSLPVVAKIWRAGCILRSQLLDQIAGALAERDNINLLMAPDFIEIMQRSHCSLRRIVSAAVQEGLPVPAFSSALAYFDSFRQARGSANLIQAQRDFFGAHGFKRIDIEGNHHGPW